MNWFEGGLDLLIIICCLVVGYRNYVVLVDKTLSDRMRDPNDGVDF